MFLVEGVGGLSQICVSEKITVGLVYRSVREDVR